MTMTEMRKKTGFFNRLSNIIIIQGVFVFVALALILFYPMNDNSVNSNLNGIIDEVNDLKEILVGLDRESLESAEGTDNQLFKAVEREELVEYLEVYALDENNQIETLFRYKKTDGSISEDELSNELTDMISPEYLQTRMGEKDRPAISYIYNSIHLVCYCYLPDFDGSPALLVSLMDHDLLISPRSNLQYLIFLLFLFSTLISLLTVYLISKRFGQPLNRLMRGLEKTAQGELYYMIETDEDDEIDNLSRAFNQMTQGLWDNKKKLKSYNTRLKKANIAMMESQMFLAALIESTPLCIIVASHTNQVMVFNRKASEVFGYNSDDVIGKDLSSLFKRSLPDEKLKESGNGNQSGFEMICHKKDGETFPAFVIVTPVQPGRGELKAYLYIIRDITESKSFQDMMVRLDRYYTRGEMAGDIAHEINNYLAILSGNIELMPLILKKGDQEKIDKKLEVMKGTCDKIACFADGLMDVPQDKMVFQQVDLNQLVENVLAFLKPQNKFDNITFELNLSSDIPLVELDPGQVQQLLVNFVFNAADAILDSKNDKFIYITTSVTEHEHEKYTRVEIADSGAGVPEEKQPALFNKRFTTKRKGHGIGLVTCRKIAVAHDGQVGYYKSEHPTFYLDIPVLRKPTPENKTEEQASKIPTSMV